MLTTPRADLAMFHVLRMRFTFVAASLARDQAGFDHGSNERLVLLRLTTRHTRRGRGDIRAIEIRANAPSHAHRHFLGQTSIGARRADRSAFLQGFEHLVQFRIFRGTIRVGFECVGDRTVMTHEKKRG